MATDARSKTGISAAGQTVDEWACMGGCANWWGERGVYHSRCPECGVGTIYRSKVGTHIRKVDTEAVGG